MPDRLMATGITFACIGGAWLLGTKERAMGAIWIGIGIGLVIQSKRGKAK